MSSRLFLASSSRGANAIRTTVEAPMLLGFGPSSLSSRTTTLAPAAAAASVGRTPMLNLARRSLHTPARGQQRLLLPLHHHHHHGQPLGTTLATTLRTNESNPAVRSRCNINSTSTSIGRRSYYSGAVALSPSPSRSSCIAGTLHCHGSSRLGTALQSSFRSLSSQSRRLQRQGGNHGRDEPAPPPVDPKPAPSGLRKVLPIPSLTAHEDIYTIPNLLTASRLIAAPFIGYAILHDAHAWTLGLFVYAGVSDLLDGWIARRWKLQSVVGSVIDPMADKILMTILTVCLATKGALPDVGLGIAAIYYRWISLPPPKTFMRYWDFSLPSAEVRPTTISKYNTFLQLALMGATTVSPLLTMDVAVALTGLQYTVAATTVWSGLSYVFSKDAVKILSDSKAKKQ
ncbi:CDP-alcohol phosphatidyltransferase [Apiospora phragmitis]|uniref:CDP-alcohol phosphatidyltransferase n=1 Tax=Apiospora phragmitis TaxID=2905665 RepID=A0ABR1T4F8_9PEZI